MESETISDLKSLDIDVVSLRHFIKVEVEVGINNSYGSLDFRMKNIFY